MKKTIALGSDHGGFELKNSIKNYLERCGYNVIDFGTLSGERSDYADYAVPACKAVLDGRCNFALLFCGTGAGMAISANKMAGIRACCCSDAFTAEFTRKHNNANVLCLGGRVIGAGLAEMLVGLFLEAEFEGGRHQTRIDKITALEKRSCTI